MNWTDETQLKERLKKDDKVAIRGLLAVYDRQTQDEIAEKATKHHNKKGFTGTDASILTSLAQWYLDKQFLTDKQMAVVRKKMPKYAGQLIKIIKGQI